MQYPIRYKSILYYLQMDSKVSMVSEFSGEGFYVAQFKTS